MITSISLSEYADELAYAAKTGAAKVSATAVARGNIQARVGITTKVPGAALQSVLTKAGHPATHTADGVDPDRIPKVADQMAGYALREGANLLSGGGKK